MVRYIHSGDQVDDKKAKNQTAGPAAPQAGNVGGGTTGSAPADGAESYAIQSADNLGEAHTGNAGEQEAPQSGTAINIAADGRGTISAAIVSAAAAAQAHSKQVNDTKAEGRGG